MQEHQVILSAMVAAPVALTPKSFCYIQNAVACHPLINDSKI